MSKRNFSSGGTLSSTTAAAATAVLPSIGDLIDGDIVYQISGDYVWLVAPATRRSSMEWGLYGTDTALPNISSGSDPNSGEYNTDLLVTNHGSSATAANWCKNHSSGTEYFLPNKEELLQIYNLRSTIDAADSSGSTNTLLYFATSGYYGWSSTENSFNNAWLLYFGNGSVSNIAKNTNVFVVPVRKLALS